MPGFQRTHGLVQGLLKRPPNRHGLTHGLHLRREGAIGIGKFFKGEARGLDHAIVDCRLERRRRLFGNVIGNFIQRVAHSELGRDFGNRKASGLGGQGRAARHAGIHLNDDEFTVVGAHGKLNVRAPGLHPNGADDADRGVSHALILFIRQRLRRCYGDAIAGMHAHGIDVFNRADDHHIIRQVPHDFQFVLFPTENRLFQEHFMPWTRRQAPVHKPFELLNVVGNIAAHTP